MINENRPPPLTHSLQMLLVLVVVLVVVDCFYLELLLYSDISVHKGPIFARSNRFNDCV